MSAFNWIQLEGTCPVCKRITALTCQTHVASSYSGDANGRFHDRRYRVGEPMRWWPREDARWETWKVGGRTAVDEANHDEEACHADCDHCGSELYVVIRFHENVPERVLDIGPATAWPEGYVR